MGGKKYLLEDEKRDLEDSEYEFREVSRNGGYCIRIKLEGWEGSFLYW